jgi:hypothetical protein
VEDMVRGLGLKQCDNFVGKLPGLRSENNTLIRL